MARMNWSLSLAVITTLAGPTACSDAEDNQTETPAANASDEMDGSADSATEPSTTEEEDSSDPTMEEVEQTEPKTACSADGLDPVIPPADETQMECWLELFLSEGWESDWFCEPEATEKGGGPHGASNRVCSNPLLAAASLDAGQQLPVGSAALKEVSSGWYVEVKIADDSAGGDGWYWRTPTGTQNAGLSSCTGCHSAAGEETGLGDFVYFRVEE